MKTKFFLFSFFISSVVALTGDQCEDLAPADCKPLNVCNTAGYIQSNDAATCQTFCDILPDLQCNMFLYDDDRKYCTLYSCLVSEFEKTCLVKSGLKNPPISSCSLEGVDSCSTFRKSECTYHGQVINTFANIRDTETCWQFCSVIDNCFSYEHSTDDEECILHAEGTIQCSQYIGPRTPFLTNCQQTSTPDWTSTSHHTTLKPDQLVSVKAVDATTNVPLSNATVSFRDVYDSAVFGQGQTDQSGLYRIGSFRDGSVVEVSASKMDYLELERNFTIQVTSLPEQTLTMALSPNITFNETRIVMSWNPQPRDLDLHTLQIDRTNGQIVCHCFYNNRNCQGMFLDVDNTQGGDNGAETITLSDPGDFVYAIFVFDFRPDFNFPLSSSGANIDLYGSEGGFLQFSVPTQEPLRASYSRYWIIGCLDPLEPFQSNNTLISDISDYKEIAKICFD